MKRQLAVHQSFQYAQNVVNGTIPAPKYVIKQCEKFLEICDGKSEKYFLDEQKLQRINDILKLLVMPRGLKAGSSIYECSCGYQWLLYAAALCVGAEPARASRARAFLKFEEYTHSNGHEKEKTLVF